MKISASVLASRILSLSSTLHTLDREKIDYIHIDVMDGNYVPQISFGEAITREIGESTSIPLDIHLMVRKPEDHFRNFLNLRPEILTFHRETTEFGIRLSDEIRKAGVKVGVSLNPSTPVSTLKHLLSYVDLILIMTVDPGFYGQKFVEGGLDKIREAKDLVSGREILIEVDGGVNTSNISSIFKAGADICVVGAGLFQEGSPNQNADLLKSLC